MFFIIGMRRSGTSILRQVIGSHPSIDDIWFEPHPLWYAVMLETFSRYKHLGWVREELDLFNQYADGAKFALNPGTQALEWKQLIKTFPEAKFIFIERDQKEVYESYYKADYDSLRGVVSKEEHYLSHARLNYQFFSFTEQHPEKAVLISYENLCKEPDKAMEPVWKLLGINNHSIASQIKSGKN